MLDRTRFFINNYRTSLNHTLIIKKDPLMMTASRLAAARQAWEYWQKKPIFLDTETTGLDFKAEIVEICLIDSDETVLFETLIKPSRRIPPDATRINGITNSMVQCAPTWREVWLEVEEILRGRLIGIYNEEFDVRMITQTNRIYAIPWHPFQCSTFCIMKLYARYYGRDRWQSLQAAGRQCLIPLPNAHRARADTLLARRVLLHMAEQHR
jgi:DNA polymerase-3 subunit epsilon